MLRWVHNNKSAMIQKDNLNRMSDQGSMPVAPRTGIMIDTEQ